MTYLLQQEPVHQNDQQKNPHKVYRTKLITLTPLKNKKLKFENTGSRPCGKCSNTSHPHCLNHCLVTWLCVVSQCHGGWQYKSRAIPASFFQQLFSICIPCCSSINCLTSGEEAKSLKKLFVALHSNLLMHTPLLGLGWTNFLLGQTVQQMSWLCKPVVCVSAYLS